jgi:predicted TIM-barrel fold metal-dependent hydrolase
MGWKYYASEEATEIFGVAGELGMVVSAHSIDMDDMDEIVRKLPNTNFVFAHPGEKTTYMRQIERMEKYSNAYLDLSGTGLFRYAMLAHGVNRVGAERFLFGTDFPVCNAAMQVAAVLSEYLTDEDYELIFSGNAKRLLGL